MSLAVAVVMIAVLAGVVIGQMTGDESGEPTRAATPQQAAPTAIQPAPQPGGAQQPSMTCEGYTASLDAQSPPGWQPTVGNRGLAYAAPPNWTVEACGVRVGWQKPCPGGVCPIRAMSAAATLPSQQCENANLAMAGVAGSKATDIRTALDEEAKTVSIIYTPENGQVPQASLGPVREFTIGSHPAVQQVATVTDIASGPCSGPTALHSMVATTVPNIEGTVMFIISLKQDTSGAPDPDVINEMVKTLRSRA